jgi:hypothetical protein
MSKHYAGRTGQTAVRYRIVVRGTSGQLPVGPLECMTMEPEGENTALVGEIVDQAQLQGVLTWLSDLGIEIVSVNPVGAAEAREGPGR